MLTASDLESSKNKILAQYQEDPKAVRAFGEEMFNQMEAATKRGLNSAIGLLTTIAAQVKGELKVTSAPRELLVPELGIVSYGIAKGGMPLAALTISELNGPQIFSTGFIFSLSQEASAIYEMDCPVHGEAARNKVAVFSKDDAMLNTEYVY